MITPLTPLPLPPTRQDPINFAARADAFLAALPDFQIELNTLASELDSIGINATQSEINAAQSATDAQDAANVAGAFADYKGLWSSLTGALNKPASVKHSNKYWFLLNDLPDVTVSEPGVSLDWEESDVVRTSGAVFTGPIEVPAGATGNQVPRVSEVVTLEGAQTINGVKTYEANDAYKSTSGQTRETDIIIDGVVRWKEVHSSSTNDWAIQRFDSGGISQGYALVLENSTGYLYNSGRRVYESGSNANGYYVRFGDGTQICTHRLTSVTSGGLNWIYPAAFTSLVQAGGFVLGAVGFCVLDDVLNTQMTFGNWNAAGTRIAALTSLVAIGRWY